MNVTGHEARIIQARQGWTITRDNGATILSRRSPLGERFSVRAEDDETIRQAVRRHAVGFDPASHVRDLIREPRPDWPGHADIGALTADARAIQTMIRRLDHALTTDPTGDERRELRESACAQIADYWRSIARGKAPATTGRETRRAVLDHIADACAANGRPGDANAQGTNGSKANHPSRSSRPANRTASSRPTNTCSTCSGRTTTRPHDMPHPATTPAGNRCGAPGRSPSVPRCPPHGAHHRRWFAAARLFSFVPVG